VINPGYRVDLQQGLEFKNKDPMDQRKITRDPSLKHLRPYDSLRFRDSTPFQLLSDPDGHRFEVDRYGWLARQWSSTKKRNPTKNEIIQGILKQDQTMIEIEMDKVKANPDEISEVIRSRQEAW